MANPITPPPPPTQDYVTKNLKPAAYFWKWLNRLQVELNKFMPALGSANQILGMNAAGTATEFKTLNDGNGIDITFPSAGNITITVHQSELTDLWEASLIY